MLTILAFNRRETLDTIGEIGQIHGEGHLHPVLSHPHEALFSFCYQFKIHPSSLDDADLTQHQEFMEYVARRNRGEKIRSKRQ